MKRWQRFFCLLLTTLLLTGCAAGGVTNISATVPDSSGAAVDFQSNPGEAAMTEQTLSQIRALGQSPDDNYRTWYEIFVYSFCDSNADGIGDLPGVISKLDYLQELGVNGIWLMPIHPSTTYHKYNVSDYYAIDPDYGTMVDLEQLVQECQKRDIHVIMDLVVNHTGSEHPWFRQSTEYLRELGDNVPDVAQCPYFDYYNFTQEEKPGFNLVPGTDWYYESRFSPDMPDLNLGSDAVRSEIEKIMAFWLEKGVSGFRIDAAKEFYSGSAEKNKEVLSWIQQAAVSIKQDVYLVAEVWDSFANITDYYESGFMSIFDYPFGDATGKIITVLRNAGDPNMVSTYATALEKADKAYASSNSGYIDAPFLSNHDVGRAASFCGGKESMTKLAGAMNLFMSGSAFIYYGEEIGMVGSGNDPSKRAPMYWNTARNDGTTTPPPECSLPESYPFGSLEEQKGNDGSVYNYYRQAIAIRSAIPAISHGRTTTEAALNQGCVSAQRKSCDLGECILLMNVDTVSATVDLSGYDSWMLAAGLSANEEVITLEGSILTLPAFAAAVLVPES